MKQELNHFMIGDSYGGNQDWFRSFMMRIGGCGAETACDVSLFFARERGLTRLYPYDAAAITKEEYVDFAHQMEKYLWPRMTGIDRLEIFVDGYGKFLRDRGEEQLCMEEFPGSRSYEEAEQFVRRQIEAGYPIPTLILNHKNPDMKEYVWHWFLINGYDDTDGVFRVKAVTYSEFEWLPFMELWNTGCERKGGMIAFRGAGGCR